MRLIVFDCDGTLVDSQQTIVTATQTALAHYELPCPERRDILHAVGLPIDVALRRHAPDIDDAMLADMITIYRDTYATLLQQRDRGQIMFEGMRQLICNLGEMGDTFLGIVTMKSGRGLNRVVDAYEIRQFFQTLKSADDGPGKPAPDLLLAAMGECGVRPEQTIMVGDTSFDMLMAKSAGACAIGVGWGYQDIDELEESGADHIVESAEALTTLLQGLPEYG